MLRHTLILGRMPADAIPQTFRAAGPWCFVGQEEHFPQWEQHFVLAPDPFFDAAYLDSAALEAQGLAARYLPQIGARLHGNATPPLPPVYWEVALGCWAIMVTQLIVGYWHRALAMVARWGEEPLAVPLLPATCSFNFVTEQDMIMQGSLGHTYTHWLLSRILESMWPAAWEKVFLPDPTHTPANNRPSQPGKRAIGIKDVLRTAVEGVYQRLPFPRVKGFTLRQSLRLSKALLANTNQTDCSQSLASLVRHAPELPFDVMEILWTSLPQRLRTARYPKHIVPAARKRTRVASIIAFEDTAYRLRLAHWRAQGHKLICIQHGGNYGNIRTASMSPLYEFAQHAFITWGWRHQTPQHANFIPLPHGLLARMQHAHMEQSATLLYIGTEITVFPYRMDSRPTPWQYVQYRASKAAFLQHLPAAIRDTALYRPYFDVPGTLQDAPWLLPQFPTVRRCTGPLEPHMLGCRLLVIDHHGTTMAQAFAADIPMVLFWDEDAWALCPESAVLLPVLQEAGIWHPTAATAAAHIEKIWNNVPQWWDSPAVRHARQQWATHYAFTTENAIMPQWERTLQTI